MRRSTFVSALMLAGSLALPGLSYAQMSADDQGVASNHQDDHGKWGWLGLLGLAGLLGLKRNDRAKDRDLVGTRKAV